MHDKQFTRTYLLKSKYKRETNISLYQNVKWYKTIEFAKSKHTPKTITLHIKMGNDARRIASAKKQMAGIHTKKHSDARSLRLKKLKK